MNRLHRIVPLVVVTVLAGLAGAGCGSGQAPDSAPEAVSPATDDPSAATLGDVVGTAPTPANGSPSMVILYPHTPTDVPVPTEPAEMDQLGRTFIPRLLLVRLGQPVLFKNSEDDLHTVHVKDEEGTSLFNVAMPIQGGLHDHLFDAAGDYAVSCEAHQEMAATIFVLTTPYAVVADRGGSFSISGVPAGSYDLVLRRAGQRHEQVIEIVAGRNELTVAFTSPRTL